MSIFLIIGKFGCKNFAAAEYFARHLITLVPSVKMKYQAFTENEFQVVLAKMRKILHCEHSGSPLIWRDLEQIGMCPTYVGGITEFFEFCQEYYNVIMPFDPDQQTVMKEEFMKEHVRDTLKTAKEKVNEKGKCICIIGSGNPAAGLLLLELIQDKLLYSESYLEIRLHENRQDKVEKLDSLIWDIEAVECPDLSKRRVIKCDNVYDAVKGCNLLIIMTEIERKFDETYQTWLANNYKLMKDLAARINEVEIISIKTIITSIYLLCFNTAVLLKYCKVLDARRTIAVTSHLGLETLQYIANISRLSTSDIFGSPVWGYIGINQIVDTCHTKCTYFNWQIRKKPRKNPLKAHLPSHFNFTSMPPVVVEKRDLCFRTHTCELIWQWVNSYKVSVKKLLGCYPYMSQVNATMHVINLWLSGDDSKEILSAGIKSDGSYGIPKGIVFSQPVILEDGKWKIYTKLAVPHYQIKLRNLFSLPIIISKRFSLVEHLPRVEDFFLPPVTVLPEKVDMIEQQKALRAKRATMLHNKEATSPQNEVYEEDEKKRLEKKNEIIEQLKNLRKEMKEIVESNPYNWYAKKIQKMRAEQLIKEQLAKEVEPETVPAVPPETDKELDEWDEEQERIKKEIEILELTAADELNNEIEKLDLINELGIIYGNKILSRFDRLVPEEQKFELKPKPKFVTQYNIICEAKTSKP